MVQVLPAMSSICGMYARSMRTASSIIEPPMQLLQLLHVPDTRACVWSSPELSRQQSSLIATYTGMTVATWHAAEQ